MSSNIFGRRKTEVIVDRPFPNLVSPYAVFFREGEEIALNTEQFATNVTYIPGIGWKLKRINIDILDDRHSDSDVGKHTITDGTLQTTPQYKDINTWSNPSLSGIAYSGTPLGDIGGQMVRRVIASAESFASELASDLILLPKPLRDFLTVQPLRSSKTSTNHDGLRDIEVEHIVVADQKDVFMFATYFNGPMGGPAPTTAHPNLTGTGKYVLDTFSVVTVLREYCTDTDGNTDWAVRKEILNRKFMSRGHPTPGRYKTNINLFWDGTVGKISFNVALTGPVSVGFLTKYRGDPEEVHGTYIIPKPTQIPNENLQPIRTDIPPDHRSSHSIKQAVYAGSGTLQGLDFSFDGPVPVGSTITVQWNGYCPPGTELTFGLFNDSGVTPIFVAPTTLVNDQYGGEATYTLPQNDTLPFCFETYYPRFNFHTTGSNLSPVLTDYTVIKEATIEYVTGAELKIPKFVNSGTVVCDIANLEVTQGGPDPTQASATFDVTDYQDFIAMFRRNGAIQIEIRQYPDPSGSPEVYSVLHHGYVPGAWAHQEKRATEVDGSIQKYSVTSQGPWVRLQSALTPSRLSLWDSFNAEPYRVTFMIKKLLLTAGFPDNMINIPVLPVKFFSTNSSDYVIEPYTPVLDLIMSWIHDYIGGYLVFDNNATVETDETRLYGEWKLIVRKPLTVSNPLCVFHRGPSELATPPYVPKYLLNVNEVYNTSVFKDKDGMGSDIARSFMIKETFQQRVEPPEATIVHVVGGAVTLPSTSVSQSPAGALLSQWAVNVNAYNAFNLNPGDPGYPDTNKITNPEYVGYYMLLYVQDFTLQSQDAVNWVCRRYYDSSCTCRIHWTFKAPLVLITDSSDPNQIRLRPLRLYDEVWAEDEDGSFTRFVVADCTPIIEKSVNSVALYHLISAPTVADFQQGPRYGTVREKLVKTVWQSQGTPVHSGQRSSVNRQVSLVQGSALMLPHKRGATLQTLDPTSPDFGKFKVITGWL